MKNSQTYATRRYVFLSIIIGIAIIILVRLSWLQIFDTSYKASASNNSRRDVTIYPSRGLIYDRNGELLVSNKAVYDLMVIPGQTNLKDTTTLCQLLDIDKDEFRKKLQKAWNYSSFKASIFEKQISKDIAGYFQEQTFKYPGFYMRPRTLRNYPRSIAAHVLGHVGEVNQAEINSDPYYVSGDYIGKGGIEKVYEEVLRGKKGVEKLLVDVHNRKMGSYMDGQFDTAAIAGKDLTATIDANLQAYGEKLMQNKIGSIVAIEPATGEILSMVSSPGYDPNKLVGRIRSKNYRKLQQDTLKPIFNRALMASYPPGSILKVPQALIGLDLNVIDSTSGFQCNQSLVGCHDHPNADNVIKSIQYSCNPYYYQVFKRIILQGKTNSVFTDSRLGLKEWKKEIYKFGLGRKLGFDIQNVKPGYIPTVEFYDHWYGRNRWAFSTIYSLSIGQGEISVIPFQMANLAAIIANRGHYIEPHWVKKIAGKSLDTAKLQPKETGIDKAFFDVAAEGMRAVVEEPYGTARRARIPDITVCGKTGTAENPHGEDHSLFIAFAPKNNPKIAISVYVENAGFGGTWAAPIASLMIEKFLTDSIQSKAKEERILNKKFFEYEPDRD
ncbi:MAG: penicillin-binding protein 2 [Bacteroidales bacterium]